MSKETMLLATADNHVIAVELEYNNNAEKSRKMRLYERYCENLNYHDFYQMFNNFARSNSYGSALEREFFLQVDSPNTDFLNREITGYDFVKAPQLYKNNVITNNYPSNIAAKANTVHFDNHVDDADIPQLIKNLGYKIEPEDNVYDVRYDAAKQQYEAVGLKRRRASVNVSKKRVKLIRNHFTFPPAEYAVLQRLLSDWNSRRRTNPDLTIGKFCKTISDAKERSLFTIYAMEQTNVNHRILLLRHELTHVKNSALQAGFGLKKGAKRLSVEDYYRLQVEDERSAYLSQIVNAANMYLKNGNPQDFTMFDGEAGALVKALKRMPESSRFSYVSNPENLMDAAFNSFAKTHRNEYDSVQFINNMKLEMQRIPMSAEADANREEFFKRRSLYYRYQLYNPQTGSYEHKNFTPLINDSREVYLSQDNITNIIEPCRQIVTRRLAEFNRDKSRGEINPALVEEAKALMRDNLHRSRLINNINGIEVSDLADDNQQPVPQPAPQPRNPAAWSRGLEAYWSKFDGYKEIANTEKEYSFSIKEGTIKYTEQSKVQVSKDAQYEAYVKLLQEPSNKTKPVIFKDSLTEEQALKLYVACVNSNRIMKGAVPRDLKKLSSLRDIPAADLQRCAQSIGQNENKKAPVQKRIIPQRER